MDRIYVSVFYLFHTVEFNLLLLLLSIKFPILKYIVIGFVFHIICDIIHHRHNKLPIISWLFFSSYIYNL